MKPTLVLERNLTKKKLINRGTKALKQFGQIRDLTLFTDYSSFAAPCKKGGRDDVREVINMFFTIEDLVPKKSKKKRKARK